MTKAPVWPCSRGTALKITPRFDLVFMLYDARISVFFGISKHIATKDKISIQFGKCCVNLLRKIMYKNYDGSYTQGLVCARGLHPRLGSKSRRRRTWRVGGEAAAVATRSALATPTRSAPYILCTYMVYSVHTWSIVYIHGL